MIKKSLPIIIILLLAFALRTYNLTEIPPGLTHDEANHGRDSMNILDGVFLFYFPLNYGSEPLYNYVVAVNMTLLGENLLSLRLVNVFAGVLLIAATYLWARFALNRWAALIGAALLAVSFWPLAVSRQALRASILPLLTMASVIFFWMMLRQAQSKNETAGKHGVRWWTVIAFAATVALTLHTYLAARVLWLIFPIFLVYLGLFHRRQFRRVWLPAILGLGAAGLLVVPMFAYVGAHPEAETRLEMLDGPLQNIASGEFTPVIENAREALLAFIWPGFGDSFLAYNIPGRPIFSPLTAVFFLIGIVVCLWRWRKPAYAFLIIWFVVGITPSIVTGATANTTRNIAAMSATYLLPAVGFLGLFNWVNDRWGRPAKRVAAGAGILWLLAVALVTGRDYFARWAGDPDVRAAYQQNLVQSLNYLQETGTDNAVVISSVYPGAAHDPSIARVLVPKKTENLRWIDARYALVFPEGSGAQLIIPSSTPLHPYLARLATPVETISLRPDDLDDSFSVFELRTELVSGTDQLVNFGDALSLLDAQWLSESVNPGDTAELITFWEIQDPTKAGPRVPPAFETDAVLFTHVLNGTGDILAQRDTLEAPSWNWQVGDKFVQVHPVKIPEETAPGSYETVVGVFDRESGIRLQVLDLNGISTGTVSYVVPLIIK